MLNNLRGKISNLKALVIDNTLKNHGEAADAAATGEAINAVQANLDLHEAADNNPHGVTKAQLGLGNVDNTTDLDKPISLAQEAALYNKVDKIEGKSLSENDFTNEYKDKLDGLENFTLSVGGTALGGVKNGGDISIAEDGTMSFTGERATVAYYTAIIFADAWEGNAAPYTAAINVNGITADDKPDIDLIASDDFYLAETEDVEWGYVYRAVTSANSVRFYAKDKPTLALEVQIKVVR